MNSTSLFKNEVKNNLHLSIPLVASQLVYACSNFMGTAMVARLGQDALAAGVLTSLVWLMIANFFLGILCAISVLISHQYGAKQYRLISKIMGQSFLFGLVVILLSVSALSLVPYFLTWTHQPPQVIQLATDYLYSLIWTVPGLVFLVIIEQFLIGVRQAKMALMISLFQVPIEIILIYALVFGKWHFPQCGIAGIGYAFMVTYTLTSIGLALYLFYSKKYQKFGIYSGISFKKRNRQALQELTRVGLPIGLLYGLELGILVIVTFFMSQFGTTMLAAHQVVMQYAAMIMTFVTAMSQAVTARVGYLAGQQQLAAIRYAVRAGVFINFCITLLIALMLWIFPTWLISIDMNIHDPNNATLIADIIPLLYIVGIFFIVDNFRFIEFGTLRGLKDTRYCLWVSIFSFWVIGLGAAYLLGFLFHFQGQGVWGGITIGALVGAFILHHRRRHLLERVNLAKVSAL